MANVKVYPSGITAYQPSAHPRTPPPKSDICGWSKNSTRSLIRWLYTVDAAKVDGTLASFSVTLRSSPPTPNDWKRINQRFFRLLSSKGIASIFWLTEWQRRGVPHLHGIVVLPRQDLLPVVTASWLSSASQFEPQRHCQDAKLIYDSQGWCEYLAKHSARGVANIQRHSSRIPPEWKGRTGRMWGHRGHWPTAPPER
jgi:hypothetical protein